MPDKCRKGAFPEEQRCRICSYRFSLAKRTPSLSAFAAVRVVFGDKWILIGGFFIFSIFDLKMEIFSIFGLKMEISHHSFSPSPFS